MVGGLHLHPVLGAVDHHLGLRGPVAARLGDGAPQWPQVMPVTVKVWFMVLSNQGM